MNAICLVIDRLHAGHLGAYGNTWIETPAMDRLASQALTFDQMLVDSPRLASLYRSYWGGRHALCPDGPLEDQPALAGLLHEAGVNTALLTDDPALAQHRLAAQFDELIQIDPPWEAVAAQEIEQTHLAQCFVQVIDWLQSAREPFLLWCHLAGLGTTWDAPAEFREAYREQGDPQPPSSAEVPAEILAEDHDPDHLLGIAQAYAGQVSLLDECVGALLEFVAASPWAPETLLVFSAARGFPLGEHRRVGPCDDGLYGELVQVPLMMRFPDGLGAAARSQALVEPADLWATLLDWWRVSQAPSSPSAESLMPIVHQAIAAPRDRLCIAGRQGERALRTPAWYLYLRAAASPFGGLRPCPTHGAELFAKPDDRWEVNDVADRCQEVVECLRDAVSQFEQTLHSGHIADLPPLSEVLVSGLG
jgi:arylsulfatase A-like enzyme